MRFKITALFSSLFLMLAQLLMAVPVITNITPNFGPVAGGTAITITGSGFTGTTDVDFGIYPAAGFVEVDDTTITATTPVAVPGIVNVIVTAASGVSTATLPSRFVFQGGNFAYVSEGFSTGNVQPIDTVTETAGAAIIMPVGSTNNTSAITPDGALAYVVLSGTDEVGIIDLATNTFTGTTIPLTAGSLPLDIAITPNGLKAYVTNLNLATLTPIDLTTNTALPSVTMPGGGAPVNVVISTDGSFVYVTDTNDQISIFDTATDSLVTTIPPAAGAVGMIGIAVTPDGTRAYVGNVTSNNGTAYDLLTNTPIGPNFATDLFPHAVAINPDGTLALFANQDSNSVTPVTIPANTPGTSIPVLGISLTDIAITPDGTKAFVTSSVAALVSVIDVLTLTSPSTVIVGGGTSGISIMPDQSPLASFTFTAPNVFDASASLSPTGTIALYIWDFDDGTPIVTTASPIIVHNFANTAAHTVTLRVVNSSGTSNTQVFTGQTLSRNGGPNAVTSLFFPSTAPTPPSNLTATQLKNKFLTQTDLINRICFTPSTDPSVISYLLYRNGALIATIPATGPYCFSDHNRKKNKSYTYSLVAVSAGGQSTPITIIVPNKNSSSSG